MVFRKSRFGWVRSDLRISLVTWPKFTKLSARNPGAIAVD